MYAVIRNIHKEFLMIRGKESLCNKVSGEKKKKTNKRNTTTPAMKISSHGEEKKKTWKEIF